MKITIITKECKTKDKDAPAKANLCFRLRDKDVDLKVRSDILHPSGQRSRAQRLGRECLSSEECRQGEEQSLQLLSQESQLRDSQGWKDCPSWFQSHSTP